MSGRHRHRWRNAGRGASPVCRIEPRCEPHRPYLTSTLRLTPGSIGVLIHVLNRFALRGDRFSLTHDGILLLTACRARIVPEGSGRRAIGSSAESTEKCDL